MRSLFCALTLLLTFALLADVPAAAQNNPGVSPNQMFGCNQSAIYDASTSGATRLVPANSSGRIYVCGFDLWAAGTVNVGLVYGTGGTCGSGTAKITPTFQFTAQTGIVDHLPVYTGLPPVPVGSDLCINASGAVAVQAIVYYTQFP